MCPIMENSWNIWVIFIRLNVNVFSWFIQVQEKTIKSKNLSQIAKPSEESD